MVMGSSCIAIAIIPPPLPPTIIRRRFAQQLLCLVLICIHLLPLFCYGSSNVSNCPQHERQALLDMINPWYGDDGFLTRSWMVGTNCCQWYGITCDRRTGHVVRIDLRRDPPDIWYELNLNRSSLLALSKHLRYLDLSGGNIIHPGVIPSFIGSFQNLRYLNLSGISFDFSDFQNVPPQLGNLSRLRTLSFKDSYNLQIDDPRWLSRLTSLQQIELELHNFEPGFVQALSMLPSIRVIRMASPYWEGAIRGFIPPSLNPLNFTNLSVLHLNGIEIDENSTTVLPRWMSSLTRLRYLGLRDCNLRGEVEAVLGNLSFASSLEGLDLSFNQLQGSIPKDTFLGSMSMLRELELSHNQLQDSIPDTLGSMSMLRILDLSGNNLSGSIPRSLGSLSRLEYLDLGDNSLTGSLTEAHFANLSSLKNLGMGDMNSHHITLDISSDWQPPFHLQSLYLSNGCQIAGGRFPHWLQTQLQSLSILYMSNTGIQDSIPRWFWIDNNNIDMIDLSHNVIFGDLPTTLHSSRLVELDLSSNHLHGPLPQLFNTPNLSLLDLSNNSFSGSISNIGSSNLNYLLLSKNNFTGEVPAFICRLDLNILDLSQNHLTGELPDCYHSVFFQSIIVDLSNNNLLGGIPDNLGSGDCHLNSLYLNNNNFSGELPSSLTNCDALNVLDLAYNEFTSNISIWLGDSITNLRTLRLRSNKCYGFLPPMLSQNKLQILDLSYNNISGTIPPSFGSFRSMMTSNASEVTWNEESMNFEDKVLLWIKGKEQTYDKLLGLVVAIDLSHNDLSGTIPEQLASLISLYSLNLSNNQLTGEITTKIGRMQQLESLDLSYNRLSGPIPPSLANLSFLEYLDLSYNNLSGGIPTGGHLDTFQDPYMYRGNPFLDSINVTTKKRGGDTTIEGASVGENTDEGIDEKFWLYISIGPGFVVGIWAVFGPLLFKKTWRYAYFRAMDAMHYKIFCRQS